MHDVSGDGILEALPDAPTASATERRIAVPQADGAAVRRLRTGCG